MFVYSMKASSLKFFTVIAAALIALVSLIFLFPDGVAIPTTAAISEKTASINYEKIKSNDDRIKFLSQFGWEVDGTAIEESEITIPAEFDRIMNGYNQIQKQQGLDLEKYKKKTAMRYTYKVKNYPGYDGDVYANIVVYRNRVIAGDVCSADVTGFISTLEMPAN